MMVTNWYWLLTIIVSVHDASVTVCERLAYILLALFIIYIDLLCKFAYSM